MAKTPESEADGANDAASEDLLRKQRLCEATFSVEAVPEGPHELRFTGRIHADGDWDAVSGFLFSRSDSPETVGWYFLSMLDTLTSEYARRKRQLEETTHG